MTKIPYNTERAVPQFNGLNSVPVATADTSAVPEATAKLANSLVKGAEAIGEIKERQDKFKYSLAYSKFLQKSIDYQNALDQDPDYANAPQKYKEGLSQIKNETLQDLGENNYADSLKEQMNLYEARNYGQVLEITNKKHIAANLAAVDEQVNQNFEAFARTKDSQARMGLIASSITAFSNAIPETDPNKALKIQQFTIETQKRAAQLDLAQKNPDEQLRLLNQENAKSGSNITKFLTPEERMQATERAKAAQTQSLDKAASAARAADYLRQRNAEENSLNTILKGGTVNDIPLDQWALLNESARKNLNDIQQYRNGTKQRDPMAGMAAFNKYSDMYVNHPDDFAKVDPITIQSEVPVDKLNQVMGWQQRAQQGIPQNNAERLFNQEANYYVKNILKLKSGSENAVSFINRFREETEAFQQDQKRIPNAQDLRKIANGLVAQASIPGIIYGTNEKPLYQIKSNEIVVPENVQNEIILQARKINPNVILTPDQIKQIYYKKISRPQ